MHFPDLEPCRYFVQHPKLGALRLLAVGWLEPGFEYPRGPYDRVLARDLQALFRDYGREFFAGYHSCGFCFEARGGIGGLPASLNGVPEASLDLFLRMPAQDAYLAVPGMIVHYMRAHEYCPPAELAAAVALGQPLRL